MQPYTRDTAAHSKSKDLEDTILLNLLNRYDRFFESLVGEVHATKYEIALKSRRRIEYQINIARSNELEMQLEKATSPHGQEMIEAMISGQRHDFGTSRMSTPQPNGPYGEYIDIDQEHYPATELVNFQQGDVHRSDSSAEGITLPKPRGRVRGRATGDLLTGINTPKLRSSDTLSPIFLEDNASYIAAEEMDLSLRGSKRHKSAGGEARSTSSMVADGILCILRSASSDPPEQRGEMAAPLEDDFLEDTASRRSRFGRNRARQLPHASQKPRRYQFEYFSACPPPSNYDSSEPLFFAIGDDRDYYPSAPHPEDQKPSGAAFRTETLFLRDHGPSDKVEELLAKWTTILSEDRERPQCWDHGCSGRQFSTFSNLLRHQREKMGPSQCFNCHRCGAEFTRKTARDGHLAHDYCKPRSSR